METKNILFISYKLCDGGAEKVLSTLANQLSQIGARVSVLLYQRNNNEYILDEKVVVLELGNEASHGNSGLLRSLNRMKAIRRVIKQENPNYVIPFLDSMVRESRLAAVGINTKVIATVRNSPYQTPSSRIGRVMRNLIIRFCAGVFVQNQSQKKYFSESIQKKTFAVPNPVTKELISSKKTYNSDIKHFITCGRLHQQKNHKMLIRAFADAVARYPDISLRIYGEGDMMDNLNNYIYELHMEDYISCMGRTDDVLSVLLDSDCFILSSDYEGMPNALMEAMAVGLPCISTDCPTGPSELIENGSNGILVPVNDSERLTEEICELINNPDKAITMGQKAKEFITENFSEDIIVRNLLKNLEAI
ncbi:MAG: glycosyltransferase [Lachnospiraceae bacterium]|nr:glycosyltransferase [Lachnospiraceae bacterium]